MPSAHGRTMDIFRTIHFFLCCVKNTSLKPKGSKNLIFDIFHPANNIKSVDNGEERQTIDL